MKVTLDTLANADYIYLGEHMEKSVAKTIALNENSVIDLDAAGKTIGIEILNASKNLPATTLRNAELIE